MNERTASTRWIDTALGRHASWVCAHTAFDASERLKELLLYLVRRRIETPDARITQVEIAVAVMGYDASFDPGTDAHVRIEVGRLRKALELFYARCPDASTARIDLPKGVYRPELRQAPQETSTVDRALRHPAPCIAIAEFRHNDREAAEAAFLLGEEALLRCQQSPLVRSGAMALTRLPAGSENDCLEAARQRGAKLMVCGSIHHLEGRLRAYITLIDVSVARVLARDSQHCEQTGCGTLGFVDAMAEQIATALVDPMLGEAPRCLAEPNGRAPLDILMRAYRFIATQDIRRIRPAIEGLRWLDGDNRLLATSGALLADLRRVATNSRLTSDLALPGECVDLAESAVSRDPKNVTARLALGYAYLNAGQPGRAAALATDCPSISGFTSALADRRLLETIAEANVRTGPGSAAPGHSAVGPATTGFFMDELADVVSAMAAGDYRGALEQLGRSVNQDIYWIQVFKAAAMTGLGEPVRARDARQRLCALLPNAASILRPTITGFFPSDTMHGPLLDSLGRAGLRLQ